MAESHSTLVFINGKPGDQVSVFDRGLQFGDGLFETLLLHHWYCPLWPLHRQRLLDGCQRLNFSIDPQLLDQYFKQLLQVVRNTPELEFGSVKVIVSRGCSKRGYLPDAASSGQIICMAFAGDKMALAGRAIKLAVSDIGLARQPLLAGLKHANRLEQVMARQSLLAGCDEALMLDTNGGLIECIASNVFFKCAGHWHTPSLQQAGVAGITRKLLLERLMPGLDLDCQQGEYGMADIVRAEEVFICSSLRGVQAASGLLLTPSQTVGLGLENDYMEFSLAGDINSIQESFYRYVDSQANEHIN